MQLVDLAEKRREEAVQKRRAHIEAQTFNQIRETLAKFVQHCLANKKKHERLLKAGCLVYNLSVPQAQWTKGLEEKIQNLVNSYSGVLQQNKQQEDKELAKGAAEEEKQNSSEAVDVTSATPAASTADPVNTADLTSPGTSAPEAAEEEKQNSSEAVDVTSATPAASAAVPVNTADLTSPGTSAPVAP